MRKGRVGQRTMEVKVGMRHMPRPPVPARVDLLVSFLRSTRPQSTSTKVILAVEKQAYNSQQSFKVVIIIFKV